MYNEERPHSSLDGKTPSEFAEAWRASNHADRSKIDAHRSPRIDAIDLGGSGVPPNWRASDSHDNWYRKRGHVSECKPRIFAGEGWHTMVQTSDSSKSAHHMLVS